MQFSLAFRITESRPVLVKLEEAGTASVQQLEVVRLLRESLDASKLLLVFFISCSPVSCKVSYSIEETQTLLMLSGLEESPKVGYCRHG